MVLGFAVLLFGLPQQQHLDQAEPDAEPANGPTYPVAEMLNEPNTTTNEQASHQVPYLMMPRTNGLCSSKKFNWFANSGRFYAWRTPIWIFHGGTPTWSAFFRASAMCNMAEMADISDDEDSPSYLLWEMLRGPTISTWFCLDELQGAGMWTQLQMPLCEMNLTKIRTKEWRQPLRPVEGTIRAHKTRSRIQTFGPFCTMVSIQMEKKLKKADAAVSKKAAIAATLVQCQPRALLTVRNRMMFTWKKEKGQAWG